MKSLVRVRGCLIAKRGVSHKVSDETHNLQKPNPPAPLPYQGMGFSKPLPASGRGLERGQFDFERSQSATY
jgi:hypothetical protein